MPLDKLLREADKMSNPDPKYLWKEEKLRRRKTDDYAFLILSVAASAIAYFLIDGSLVVGIVSLNALWTLKLIGQTRDLEESQRRLEDVIEKIHDQLRH